MTGDELGARSQRSVSKISLESAHVTSLLYSRALPRPRGTFALKRREVSAFVFACGCNNSFLYMYIYIISGYLSKEEQEKSQMLEAITNIDTSISISTTALQCSEDAKIKKCHLINDNVTY